ncbi:uncharacterized protein V1518DRAFT_420850 [Limtongia smithiae]|uniref:uncharacterized protein n=1 Tax=Limtongia smithiae TaxID=1125753 RepID=UPI0034CE1005
MSTAPLPPQPPANMLAPPLPPTSSSVSSPVSVATSPSMLASTSRTSSFSSLHLVAGANGSARHHHASHKMSRTMSGFDLASLPEAEQMQHLLGTLRKSMRRSAEIRRKLEAEGVAFGSLSPLDEDAIAKHGERVRKLQIELDRSDAFVRRYTVAITHLSEISCESMELPPLSPTASFLSASVTPILEDSPLPSPTAESHGGAMFEL